MNVECFEKEYSVPPIKVEFQEKLVMSSSETDHAALRHLDYENSGHTGFASKEDIAKTYAIPTKVIDTDSDYFKIVRYEDLDYPFAKEYFLQTQDPISIGGCSAVYKDGMVGRNLDWIYNKQLDYQITTKENNDKYATQGVGSISLLTTDNWFIDNNEKAYKLLPFYLQDGFNSRGVYANINVVPADYDCNETIPIIEQRERICAIMLVRYILDNFASAQAAVQYIKNYVQVYFPDKLHEMNYEAHFMVADKDNCFIIEFIDNEVKVIEHNIITNFHLYGVVFNDDGSVYTPESQSEDADAIKTNKITEHGSGLERYNLIAERYSELETAQDFAVLMSDLFYTRAYITSPEPSVPYWYSEFVGGDLKVNSVVDDFTDIVNEYGQIFAERTREPSEKVTWQTTHSCVYDLCNLNAWSAVQESKNYSLLPSLVDNDVILMRVTKGEVLDIIDKHDQEIEKIDGGKAND